MVVQVNCRGINQGGPEPASTAVAAAEGNFCSSTCPQLCPFPAAPAPQPAAPPLACSVTTAVRATLLYASRMNVQATSSPVMPAAPGQEEAIGPAGTTYDHRSQATNSSTAWPATLGRRTRQQRQYVTHPCNRGSACAHMSVPRSATSRCWCGCHACLAGGGRVWFSNGSAALLSKRLRSAARRHALG